jgi:hypothetical protein
LSARVLQGSLDELAKQIQANHDAEPDELQRRFTTSELSLIMIELRNLAEAARTFGADPVPWDGDDPANGGTMSRVIGSASSDNGSFWSPGEPPQTEAEWRGGSAVKNDWNGNGAYVQSPTAGLKGWTGPAAPQLSRDGANVLPGGSQQIWLPPGSATPSPPQPSPWH